VAELARWTAAITMPTMKLFMKILILPHAKIIRSKPTPWRRYIKRKASNSGKICPELDTLFGP
jgi:hypothetical protein